jgi:hypothetical protein
MNLLILIRAALSGFRLRQTPFAGGLQRRI